jgi:excisionase family DNA binding protein
MAEERLVYTPRELSALIRIRRDRLYKLLRQGAIKSVRIGNTWHIPRAEVMRLLGREE